MRAPSKLGLYVHVPFCANRCDYCAFYKETLTPNSFDDYLLGVKTELSLYKDFDPETIFIGGGTPSFLPEKKLAALMEILRSYTKNVREFTVEVSPLSINRQKLEILKEGGVSRISVGIQSFNEKVLQTLGRKVAVKKNYEALALIASANFADFNADFIFAVNGQTTKDFARDIEIAAKYPLNHISAYCIEYESKTPLCAGRIATNADEEREADFVEFAALCLKEHGFYRYEISNYAKPGCECAHNLGTWNMYEWVGVASGAASQYNNVRSKNIENLKLWCNALKTNKSFKLESEKIDNEELFLSAIIFGLRMVRGVDLNELAKRFPITDPKKYKPIISDLVAENLATLQSGNLRLTKKGLLLADAVALRFC